MGQTHNKAFCARVAALVLLAACGGGGGGAASPPPPPPPPPLPSFDQSPVAMLDPGSSLPDGWMHAGMLEIYVRGYQDSDGDGVGDLRGLMQRLDYIAALGVGGIWLMPVTQSQDRDHGYAVSDYRAIESDYGALDDMDALLQAAHARGLGVIIDYVMNHSAEAHPAFVNARDSAGNAFRNWYVWSATRPTGWSVFGGDPWRSAASGWYYGAFSSQMPDFNLRNADVVAWHENNLRFWLNRGVDGFRFDAVGVLFENGPSAWENQPENYGLLRNMRRITDAYQRRYMVCEGPSDPQGYADAAACGSAFAFDHNADVIAAARADAAAVQRVSAYPGTAPSTIATFASNHDSFAGRRLWDQLNGDLAQYRLAAATYLLQPGIPFIYYGEEVGMAGAALLSGDHALRTPMSWTNNANNAGFTTGSPFRALSANSTSNNVAAQESDANSLLNFYRTILSLRRTRASLSRGDYAGAKVEGTLLSFRRTLAGEQSIVILNYGTAAGAANLNGLDPNATYDALYPAGGASFTADVSGAATVPIAAQNVAVYARR